MYFPFSDPVVIVNGLRAAGRRIEVRLRGGNKILPFPNRLLEPLSHTCSWCREQNVQKCKAFTRYFQCRSQFFPYVFTTECLIKCRQKFTLIFTKITPLYKDTVLGNAYILCPMSDIPFNLRYSFVLQTRKKIFECVVVYLCC